jgi:hypothetical protein
MPNYRCAAARNLSILERDGWDGPGAKSRIFSWAGWPDDPDPAKARRAFLAYDADDPELKGSYSLPFADVDDGSLKAVDAGLRAAASRLPQTDIPDDVKEDARSVLDAYFAKMDDEDEERIMDKDTFSLRLNDQPVEIYAHPAEIVARAAFDTDELTKLAKDRARDPSIFEEFNPYFWRAQISNTTLDTFYTHMDVSTLRNFASDAEAGVAFMTSHDVRRLPLGASLAGRFVNGRSGSPARVEADFFTLRGLNTNGVSADEFINGVRAGIVTDVSVGFYGGQVICDVCGRDLFDWDCWHIPGLETFVVDKDGNKTTERIIATAGIYRARLSEVSGVFDGATPGATILKAEREVREVLSRSADTKIRPEMVGLLEQRYRIKLPALNRTFASVEVPKEEEQETVVSETQAQVAPEVVEPERQTDLAEVVEAIEARRSDDAAETEVPSTDNLETVVEETPQADTEEDEDMTTTNDTLRAALAKAGVSVEDGNDVLDRAVAAIEDLPRLRALADTGRQYRADLIEETIREGIRAKGDDFAAETYRGLLGGIDDIDMIKRMRDDFKGFADATFAGGRVTPGEAPAETEETPVVVETPETQPTRRSLPSRAYAA